MGKNWGGLSKTKKKKGGEPRKTQTGLGQRPTTKQNTVVVVFFPKKQAQKKPKGFGTPQPQPPKTKGGGGGGDQQPIHHN